MREQAIAQCGRPIRARIARRVAFCLAFGLSITFGICILSYYRDQSAILTASSVAIENVDSSAQKVLRLNDWAHGIGSTARNENYFLVPRLRATPVQVLHGGGDCADKSRLLWAALRAHGVPATMVMLFDPATKAPTHTVVEACLGEGQYMVADPAFNLTFPKPDGTYFSLLDLRAEPSILDQRLEELLAHASAPRELRGYRRDICTYQTASSINWNRNLLTRAVYSILHPIVGEDVYRLSRPAVLEEPKLAVAAGALGLAIICGAVPCLLAKVQSLAPRGATRPSPERCVERPSLKHRIAGRDPVTPSHLPSAHVAS